MGPDFSVILGDFKFQSAEVPAQIPEVGGSQQLVVHQLIGGVRVIDRFGRSDNPLTWEGWFRGKSAQARADFIDAYRINGTEVQLTWADRNYQVVVREFAYEFRRRYELRYRIACEVLASNTAVSTQNYVPAIDSALADDLNTANSLTAGIGDSTLTSLMSSVSKAIKTVATFSNAVPSSVNKVLQPLAAVASRTAALQASGNLNVASAPGLAGVVAGATPRTLGGKLNDQAFTMQQLVSLSQLQGVVGRMGQNLNAINASDHTIPVTGGNLFSVASSQYGDAQSWTTIAHANGLTDPFIAGPTTLTVPAQPDQASGGVLNA